MDYESSVGQYTRPKRPCKFCGRMQTHLSRHILSVHKDEREVVEISEFTLREKTVAMNRMKKDGILRENRIRLNEKGENLALLYKKRKKASSSSLKLCIKCSGFDAAHLMWKHLLKCPGDKGDCDMQGVQFDRILATTNNEFNNKHCSQQFSQR